MKLVILRETLKRNNKVKGKKVDFSLYIGISEIRQFVYVYSRIV